MHKPHPHLSILLATGLLAGCGTGEQPPQQPPTPEQAAKPTPSNTYPLTEQAAGPVQLGMAISEIITSLPDIQTSMETDSSGVQWVNIQQNNEPLLSVMVEKPSHRVSVIRVLSPRFVTKQGVQVGENLQSASEKLGGLRSIQLTEVESREFATFQRAPETMVFQVTNPNGGTAGVYQNDKTETNLTAPSATIHSIWLVQGD